MSRVASQENSPNLVALSQPLLRLPGENTHDFYREVRYPDSLAHQLLAAFDRWDLQLSIFEIPGHLKKPAITIIDCHEQALSFRGLYRTEYKLVASYQLAQVCTKVNRECMHL